MPNFIHYKDQIPVNLSLYQIISKKNNYPYCIVFTSDVSDAVWGFDNQEERDDVYNLIIKKYSSDLNIRPYQPKNNMKSLLDK